MERRSWLWKRKSYEKASGSSDSVKACLTNIAAKQKENGHTDFMTFVEISVEKYKHFNTLEEKVEFLKEKLNDLNKKLSTAQEDKIIKDDVVRQHVKVAEEAIFGWEKAKAENLSLKHQLESVTLLKLVAEKQAGNLDSALKECMTQIRNMKEESEKKLEIRNEETKRWQNARSELEAAISGFKQELFRNSSETRALSKCLQDRSALLMKIHDKKIQADAEIVVLSSNLQSNEKEINSLRYELNIVTKELEIRNEETNMSVKSAEVAQKQRIDDVKKITKLDAECQRLRGLLRKRLPGPTVLAQMKLEVEGFGHGFKESKVRRQSSKNSSSHNTLFSQEVNGKENKFLSACLLVMEEEAKMLKEALSKRNSELQDTLSMCAKTDSKLHIIEAQMHAINQQKSLPKENSAVFFEGSSSQNKSNYSLASMSEDGIDEAVRKTESWVSALTSDMLPLKKEKTFNRKSTIDSSNQLEFMGDSLKMERLAGLSSESNGDPAVSNDGVGKMKNENCDDTSSVDVHIDVCKEQAHVLNRLSNFDVMVENRPSENLLSKILSRITSAVESKALNSKAEYLVEKIMTIMQDFEDEKSRQFKDHLKNNSQINIEAEEKYSMNQDLTSGISCIHDFVILFYKELSWGKASEHQQAREKLKNFSDFVYKIFHGELKPTDIILLLFYILYQTKKFATMVHEAKSDDSIDKEGMVQGGCELSFSLEVEPELHDLSSKELGNLKMRKDAVEQDLLNCRETLEHTKLQLVKTE